MAKRKKNGRLPRFVALPWDLLKSKAYIDLKYSSAKALPAFLGKLKLPFNDEQYYLTTFSFSYSEAKLRGFSSATFYKIICDLVLKGFIDPVSKGGLRGDRKSNNLFRLSDRWINYENYTFKKIEWPTFQPPKNRNNYKK